jgi:hypothetical protein
VTRTAQRVRLTLSSIAREVKVTGGGLSVQARCGVRDGERGQIIALKMSESGNHEQICESRM